MEERGPTFITRVDAAALLTEFLQNVRTEEVITELLQNELDQGARTTTISFERDRLVAEGDGRPVDRAGWERLTYVLGAGLAPPISLDSRLAKTAGPERKGRDGPEAEGEQGDRRS